MYEDIIVQLRYGLITQNDFRRMLGLQPTKPMFYTARVIINDDLHKVHDVHKALYKAILEEIQKDYPAYTMDDIREDRVEWATEIDYEHGIEYYQLVYEIPAITPVYKPTPSMLRAEHEWERKQKNLEGWDDF